LPLNHTNLTLTLNDAKIAHFIHTSRPHYITFNCPLNLIKEPGTQSATAFGDSTTQSRLSPHKFRQI